MDPRVEKIISEVKELAAQAQTLSSAVIHNSGQPTIQNPNMLRPPQIQAPQMGDDNASALSGGLYAAQVKVTTSQQQLQSAQVLYKQAVDDLQKITTDLAQFTEELKALSDEKIDVGTLMLIHCGFFDRGFISCWASGIRSTTSLSRP